MANISETLEAAVIGLIKTDRFYGNLLVGLNKRVGNDVPTAAVGIMPGDLVPTLFINPNFFGGLTPVQRVGLLRHEMMHLILMHMDRKADAPMKDWNIATDMAINCYCPELDEVGGVTVAKVAKELGIDIRERQHSEYYLEILKKYQDENPSSGSGDGSGGLDGLETTDSHDLWEQLSEEQKQLVKQMVNSVAGRSSTSELPTFIKAQLEKLKDGKPIDWKQKLRAYVGQAIAPFKEKTRKRLNRRYGIIFQGKKKEYTSKLALCLDTSGSVSDKLVTAFFVEIDKITENFSEIVVIECDTQVRAHYSYKKGQSIVVNGRGGTRYQPAIDFALKQAPDVIIMFGDGDHADDPIKPRVPVIWCNPCDNPSKFGRFIKLEANV
jgi:predicted metal-dependent peptidase